MMLLACSGFFGGGILSSLSIGREPSWFLFIQYISDFMQELFLQLAFMVAGLSLIVGGIGTGPHYYRDRR